MPWTGQNTIHRRATNHKNSRRHIHTLPGAQNDQTMISRVTEVESHRQLLVAAEYQTAEELQRGQRAVGQCGRGKHWVGEAFEHALSRQTANNTGKYNLNVLLISGPQNRSPTGLGLCNYRRPFIGSPGPFRSSGKAAQQQLDRENLSYRLTFHPAELLLSPLSLKNGTFSTIQL